MTCTWGRARRLRGSRGKRGGERAFWGRGGVLASLSTTCRGESKETARAEANQVANDGAQVGQRFGRRRPATGVVAKRKIGIFPRTTGADGHCLGGADTIANVRGNFYAQDLPARGQTSQNGPSTRGPVLAEGVDATLAGWGGCGRNPPSKPPTERGAARAKRAHAWRAPRGRAASTPTFSGAFTM
jgi:hypothetical protein